MVWTFADQALSSATNAAVAVLVARSVGAGQFAAFSLALLTFGFVVGLVRSFVGDPYVVRFSAADDAVRREGAARATGAALTLGLAAGAVCLGVAALTSAGTAAAFAALGLALPGLVLQDTWRHTFFAAGRPAAATVNDLVWTVLQFGLLGLLGLLGALGHRSVFLIVLAWGLSALVAAAVGVVQSGVRPRPARTREWLVETRDLNLRLGIGFAVNMGAVNLATYLVGALVGLVAVGALRAAQVLLGPLNLLFAGFNAFALPYLSRTAAAGGRLVRPAVLGSGALGLLTSAWVGSLLLLPDRAGRAVLGDSWAGAHAVLLPSGLVLLAGALSLGASNCLVALSRADLLMRVTLVQGPLMLALGAAGAWGWGVVAAAYGFAVAQATGLVLTWTAFRRADSRPANS